jgi:hypothetical protein
MSTEAREIADAIRTAYRERTGACPLPDALAAAPVTDGRRWVIAVDRDYQFAAMVQRGGMSVWWRRGFMSPEWQPYEYTVLPIVLWMPADPANLPPGFTLPETRDA